MRAPLEAHAAARFAGATIVIVAPGSTRRAITGLPLSDLRLAPARMAELRVLGFETTGDLARTPRAPLTQRFGPKLGRRLDQAFGDLPELVEARHVLTEPIWAPETIARSKNLDRSTSMPKLSHSTRQRKLKLGCTFAVSVLCMS